ncbi:MAG: fatty acid desaturase [Planctomycetes bacterium]|nr:fatty acid desaturase [Planctomycetota bacterium]
MPDTQPDPTPAPRPTLDVRNLIFMTLSPVIAIPGTIWYTYENGFEWWMPALFLVLYSLVGLSVTAGYHRCFSHRSYECAWIVQVFYAIFGAMSFQNSALWWSAGHRRHHRHVDGEFDPYNIRKGFWWAHILWTLDPDPEKANLSNVPDLEKMPVVRWQHRYLVPLMLVFGFGMPAFIGWCFGDWVAGLLWGGFLRIVLVHHCTFFINSLAHTFGKRTYDRTVSARDNAWVALVAFGEGFHNFHHRFPADYRNGIRWFHWDPAKWFIRGLMAAGLAWDLRRTPESAIAEARRRAGEAAAEPPPETAVAAD